MPRRQRPDDFGRDLSPNPEKTSFATGMGPNQFFNADLKDRAILLVRSRYMGARVYPIVVRERETFIPDTPR